MSISEQPMNTQLNPEAIETSNFEKTALGLPRVARYYRLKKREIYERISKVKPYLNTLPNL